MRQEDQTTSEHLKGFVLRPAPPELRQKVLAAAGGIRSAGRFLSPVQWGMVAACVLLMIGSLAGDALISRSLAGRLDILLKEGPAASPGGDADRAGLEEFVGVDQARSLYMQSTRPRHDRASRIEERMDWKDRAVEEKEDADVHSKNPR